LFTFFLKKIKQDFLNLTGANFIYPFYPSIKKDNGIFKGEKKLLLGLFIQILVNLII